MAESNEIVQALMSVEVIPDFPKQNLSKKAPIKIPLAELAAGTATFATLSDMFRTVTQTVNISVDGLYKFTSRGYEGSPTALRDGSGYSSTVVRKGEGIVGQGAYVPVDNLGVTTSTTMPFDPATLAIAVALADINQKLDVLQATQEEMFEFIKEDKRAEIRGDMKVLAEIANNYKFNNDNDQWMLSRYQGVLDIKRRSEQHIEFYSVQIEKKSAHEKFLHADKDVAKKSADLVDYFGQYQAALYLFGFSTFLDVVFTGNFDSEYLKRTSKKLDEYGLEYRSRYTKTYDKLDAESATSIEGTLTNGVASASSMLGKAISKVPILEKGPVDEALQDAGAGLKGINKDRQAKALEQLISRRDVSVLPFARNVKLIDDVHNGKSVFYLDDGTLYCEQNENEN